MWRIARATYIGRFKNPAPGDRVEVTIYDTVAPKTARDTFRFTYDGTITRAAFLRMIRAEVRAELQRRNLPEPPSTDITQQVE